MMRTLRRDARTKERASLHDEHRLAGKLLGSKGRRILVGASLCAAVFLLAAEASRLASRMSTAVDGVDASTSRGISLPEPPQFSIPAIGIGLPTNPVDGGSSFLSGAALRLGLAEMPPDALPAAARAYRAQFGHGMDDDLPAHQAEVEEWLVSWRAAYDRGEVWARGMASP